MPDAVAELSGDLPAAPDDLRKIDLHIAHRYAVLPRIGPQLANECPVFEQRFGGDAAQVGARPAEVFLLDAEHALFQLARADGGRVAARPAADDDQIKVVSFLRNGLRSRLRLGCRLG